MSIAKRLMQGVGGEENLYVDDVFSAYTYTGNGSTQTINNGIDLAGKGGMVWLKERNRAVTGHILFSPSLDSGANNLILQTNSTSAASNIGACLGYNSTGFSPLIGGSGLNDIYNYASWTFRKSPKFFDVVTYTGNGVAGRQIPHSLGIAPGMVIVKCSSSNGNNWVVYHTALGYTKRLFLNTTDAAAAFSNFWYAPPTSAVFSVGPDGLSVNDSGATYVAYLFAHDPSADGIIQCGSFTTAADYYATAELGWEPQYVLFRKPNTTDDWKIVDTARGMPVASAQATGLWANTSAAEAPSGYLVEPKATGFSINASPGTAFIYLAIRRPNKPPTTGTEVYNAIARTGTGAAATVTGVGFAPDLVWHRARNVGQSSSMDDRLRGVKTPLNITTSAEQMNAPSVLSFDMNGITVGTDTNWNGNGVSIISHFFKRAPGVFDIVCYTGTGVAHSEPHSLGVAPELVIIKRRNAAEGWAVGGTVLPSSTASFLWLNSSSVYGLYENFWAVPTATTFGFGSLGATDSISNASNSTYVAYLFASKPGISKVGKYTGNGSSQTVDCGFTTGSRFILIKRTDATGDWFTFDTVRGIVASTDPHLSLNTTAAEVTTDDSVDADTSGFIVNQVAATNINVTGASYIFLSFA